MLAKHPGPAASQDRVAYGLRREQSAFIANNHSSILVCIKWLELLRALPNDARDVVNARSKE